MATPGFGKMNETQRLIASIVVIVVGSAILGTVWGLGLKEQGTLKQDVAAARSNLETARRTLDRLDDLLRRQRESLAQDRRRSQMLPDQPRLEVVYETLQAIEEQAGRRGSDAEFTILSGKTVTKPIVANKPQANQNFEEVLLELEAEGSWAGFVSFLDGIEHADRLMTVKAFRTEESGKGNPLFRIYRITLGVYVMKPQGGQPTPVRKS